MKKNLFVVSALLIVLCLCSNIAGAQRTKKPANTGGATTAPPKGGTAPTTATDTSRRKKPATAAVKPTKTIKTVAEMQGENSDNYGGEPKVSLRNAYGYKRENVNDRRPLPYDHVREEDATYSQFVWREIDGREKMNLPFIYKAKDETGDQRFFSILLNAIKKDSIMVFEDEAMTTPLAPGKAFATKYVEGVYDTSLVQNIDDPTVEDTVLTPRENREAPAPDSVYKFRVKEQWLFDKEASRLIVRIIAIAPLAAEKQVVKLKNGAPTPARVQFWVYYPDLRASLSKAFAYNPKNVGARMTWEEIFEGRFFSSYITKSTLDNPNDKTLAQLNKDPLFRLLEGENIKEKIFNYEQDLWSY